MDVFIYFPPDLEVERDEIEDALESAFGEVAEVTGGGSGAKGSNVDLVIDDKVSVEKALNLIRSCLTGMGIRETKIVINGREWPIDPKLGL